MSRHMVNKLNHQNGLCALSNTGQTGLIKRAFILLGLTCGSLVYKYAYVLPAKTVLQ